MSRNAPLAELRRVGLGAGVRFTNPTGRGFVQIEETFESVGGDDLNRGIGTHRGRFENLHNDTAREVRVHDITAIGIGTDRESLALFNAHDFFALAEEGVERGLVAFHVGGTEGADNGTATAGIHGSPFLGLAVEVENIAVLIGHDTRLTLRREDGFVGNLLSLFEVFLDLAELGLGHDIGGTLLFDLGKPFVVGLLELFESGVKRVNRSDCLLDFL